MTFADTTWFDPTPVNLQASARILLENYSKLDHAKVIDHLVLVRDKAWKIFPYPCIGQFRFVDLALDQTPVYQEVVARLKDGEKFLDLACCFGQEIRNLVAEGVPSENLYGTDLRREYFDLGYDLFRDKESLQSTLIEADFFDPDSELQTLKGQIDIIYAGSFFHLFGWDKQVEAGKLASKLLKPQRGSMIVGRQMGSTQPEERTHKILDGTMFVHNVQSLQKQWNQIGAETDVEYEVSAELREMAAKPTGDQPNQEPVQRIWFVIRRI